MPPRPDPDWNIQAHLWGLPYTNWKKRTGYEMRGTLAECIERFLSLPYHQQINCELSWDPPESGTLEADGIRRLVERIGPPPTLAAQRQISQEKLAAMMAKPVEDFRPQSAPYNDGASVGVRERTEAESTAR